MQKWSQSFNRGFTQGWMGTPRTTVFGDPRYLYDLLARNAGAAAMNGNNVANGRANNVLLAQQQAQLQAGSGNGKA